MLKCEMLKCEVLGCHVGRSNHACGEHSLIDCCTACNSRSRPPPGDPLAPASNPVLIGAIVRCTAVLSGGSNENSDVQKTRAEAAARIGQTLKNGMTALLTDPWQARRLPPFADIKNQT